jgi:hypothetical protein
MTKKLTAKQIHAQHSDVEIEAAIMVTYDTSYCDASREMLRERKPCIFCNQNDEDCSAIIALRELTHIP